MPIRGSPRPLLPSTGWSRSTGMGGRDQSERRVAINRNSWSRSSGARTQHPETIYLIVRDGDDRPRLEALAVELGVKQQVRFAAFVAAKELAVYYRLGGCARGAYIGRTRIASLETMVASG